MALTAPPPVTPSPALWNPGAAALWSFILTPALGAYLHARNAEVLGRAKEAKENRVFFYVMLAYFGVIVVTTAIPAVPESLFTSTQFGLFGAWYFSLARKQIKYVKETYGKDYERKPWTKPLLITFGCLVAFVVLAMLVTLAAALLGVHDSPDAEPVMEQSA